MDTAEHQTDLEAADHAQLEATRLAHPAFAAQQRVIRSTLSKSSPDLAAPDPKAPCGQLEPPQPSGHTSAAALVPANVKSTCRGHR